ncbi:hypothetical protein EHS25_009535 [Saitozyma podzolica]|uniref:Uncharacterized protein n=1 Tax=Saitozyma podzolica TaxID=1890683 RepID=A0A427YJJ9_9TREE|nr:hypothetical protein EHS25_009535 [Saitozyma podzolica]
MLAITYVLAILALVAPALGRVYNMTAPATGTQGTNITAVLYSESYIQNWDDFGVIWGLENPEHTCGTCVGNELSYNNLYGTPYTHNSSFSVPIPDGFNGTWYLVAAMPYLVGASGETGIRYFNTSIVVS